MLSASSHSTASASVSSFLFGSGNVDFRPSICSNKSGLIFAHIGSSTKSMPSRRANLAAGTKSLSPDIRIMRSTCCLKAREAISKPMRISTPFCFVVSLISSSVKLLISIVPLISFLVNWGLIHQLVLASSILPSRIAVFLFCVIASMNFIRHFAFSDLLKSIFFLVMGCCRFFLKGGQS